MHHSVSELQSDDEAHSESAGAETESVTVSEDSISEESNKAATVTPSHDHE